MMQARWIAAIVSAAMITGMGSALPQTPPPTIVQVPPAGASNAAVGGVKIQTAMLPVTADVTLTNGEGPISAGLGDLLARGGTSGLETVHVAGRARRVSASGATIGQVIWTWVAIEEGGEIRSAPLANPLKSSFAMRSPTIAGGSRIPVYGDLDALLATARGLIKKPNKPEAKEAAKPATAAATAATTPATATGGSGPSN